MSVSVERRDWHARLRISSRLPCMGVPRMV